jgi:hypothetical protein
MVVSSFFQGLFYLFRGNSQSPAQGAGLVNTEYMNRADIGVKFDIISGTLPYISSVIQKVVHLIGMLTVKSQCFQGKLHPA